MCGSRGCRTGVRTPLRNKRNIGFLNNTGPDPLKITKLPSQHSIFGHHRPASEMPFKWRFAGGSMVARLLWYLDPLSHHQLKNSQIWTPSEKTFWIRACIRPSFIQVDHYKMLTGPTRFSGSAQEIHLKICKLKTSPIHFEYQIQLLKEPIRASQ